MKGSKTERLVFSLKSPQKTLKLMLKIYDALDMLVD